MKDGLDPLTLEPEVSGGGRGEKRKGVEDGVEPTHPRTRAVLPPWGHREVSTKGTPSRLDSKSRLRVSPKDLQGETRGRVPHGGGR